MFSLNRKHFFALATLPILIVLLCCLGPFETETIYSLSGFGYDIRPGVLWDGQPTIDPNIGTTSFALGYRAAQEMIHGHLPLWNSYEGLGSPLLGEMQSAAMFPPSLLLLLPHGQEIEHALLQFIGGLGAFLFFRRFGLGATAALTGALLFEVNGVFAWLRNAIFNPVAFLPWLFLAIEQFYIAAGAGERLRERLGPIALGAVMAAMALYSGFPEEVYLYSFLLLLWAGARLLALPAAARGAFAVDLLFTGVLATALSAPLLLAFAMFLQEATSGQHDQGFYGWIPFPGTLIQYIAPYLYGPIFKVQTPPTWGNIGGYTGFSLVVAAAGGLLAARPRWTAGLLLAWLVIALGASHGLPGVYQAFMALPLTKLAACYRYLNASWVFAAIFLAALFIDRIPQLPPAQARRLLLASVAMGLALTLAAVFEGRHALRAVWDGPAWRGEHLITAALVIVALSGFLAAAAMRIRTAAVTVSAILVAEATVWFFVPFLSHPKAARLDTGAIAFLQEHLGLQRIVGLADHVMGPNYGSYFGIADLGYNDLPVPKTTVSYIARNLDDAVGQAFMLAPSDAETRMNLFAKRVGNYANAGVKYLTAPLGYGTSPLVALTGDNHVHDLAPGESVRVSAVRGETADPGVAGVNIIFANRARDATGRLQATLCAGEDCARGTSEIAMAQNLRPSLFRLDHSLTLPAGAAFTLEVTRLDGQGRFGYVTRQSAGGPELLSAAVFSRASALPVYDSVTGAIFELPGVRNYFSAPGCETEARSRNEVSIRCPARTTLTRLELDMRGWSAAVNGTPTAMGQEDATFQTVEVPAGVSVVTFDYAPPGFTYALLTMLGGLACVGGVLMLRLRQNRHQSAMFSVATS